jgi:hypothetical protein
VQKVFITPSSNVHGGQISLDATLILEQTGIAVEIPHHLQKNYAYNTKSSDGLIYSCPAAEIVDLQLLKACS